MKKSFSLSDLSRQPDAALVSYKPSTERIVEDRDEPGTPRSTVLLVGCLYMYIVHCTSSILVYVYSTLY